MKTLLIMTAAVGALVVTGMAQAQAEPRGDRAASRGAMALAMLGAADLNGDNTVTRAEVERLRTDEFNWRDRNGDGYLDREDASPTQQRLAEQRGDAREGGRRGRRGPGRLDADGDQRISQAEFLAGADRIFERLDTNGDAAISPQELDAVLEGRQARRQARFWWRD
jgi:hypothetical protein